MGEWFYLTWYRIVHAQGFGASGQRISELAFDILMWTTKPEALALVLFVVPRTFMLHLVSGRAEWNAVRAQVGILLVVAGVWGNGRITATGLHEAFICFSVPIGFVSGLYQPFGQAGSVVFLQTLVKLRSLAVIAGVGGCNLPDKRRVRLGIHDQMEFVAPVKSPVRLAVDVVGAGKKPQGGVFVSRRKFALVGQIVDKTLGIVFFGVSHDRLGIDRQNIQFTAELPQMSQISAGT